MTMRYFPFRPGNQVWFFMSLLLGLLAQSGCKADSAATVVEGGIENSVAKITVKQTELRDNLPVGFIGFNMNFFNFQNLFWDRVNNRVNPELITYLAPFGGAFYRYPGGLIANTFDWDSASLEVMRRPARKSVGWSKAEAVLFGPAEYQEFLQQVGGRDWYVLNLVGWDNERMIKELDSEALAGSNTRLAQSRVRTTETPRYYQLGNELDRSEYQWPTDKYVQRSLESIHAIQAIDPEAKFVAFLRDFDWRYRGRPGVSKARDFARDVLTALPMVNDFSLQIYYDTPSEEGRKSDITWRLRMVQEIIDQARYVRSGVAPDVWITEHARAMPKDRGLSDPDFASGLSGAISSADFIIGITQIPEIRGAFWHALGGGKWNLIDKGATGKLQPTPVYWMLRLLRENMKGRVLKTMAEDSHVGGYEGGYDLRAVALYQPDKQELTLWAVNRAGTQQRLGINYAPFSGKRYQLRLSYLNDKTIRGPGANPVRHANAVPLIFDSKGNVEVSLPENSVSVLRISTR